VRRSIRFVRGGLWLALVAGAALVMQACGGSSASSTDAGKDGAAGKGGMSGSGGKGGADAGSADAGKGGASAGGAGGTIPPPPPCTPIVAMTPVLDDFSMGDNFGDFFSTPSGTAEAYGGLTTDTSGGNWHITGTVSGSVGSAGFFLDFLSAGCVVDLSLYQGIQFTIGGSVGPSGKINLQVFTGEDNFVQTGNAPPTDTDILQHNSCLWKNNMYSECLEPTRTITVPAATPAAPATLSFTWNQFTGGRPKATPDPMLISRIQFLPLAPSTGADAAGSYDIDVVLDDFTLVGGPSDGGAEAGSDAPVDAAPDAPADVAPDAPATDGAAPDAAGTPDGGVDQASGDDGAAPDGGTQ
jgi:hypothetical protein